MTDLRTLLKESAPTPSRSLDVVELHRRADRSAARRWVAWLAGLGAVLGLAGPVGIGVLSPADRGDSRLGVGRPTSNVSTATTGARVDAADAPATTIRSAATSAGARSREATGGASDLPPESAVESPDPEPSRTPNDLPVPATAIATQADYPPARACTVDDVDLGAGEQRRCRFTATTPGGASLRTSGPASPAVGTSGEVFVTREGATTKHEVQYQSFRAGELHTFVGCSKFIKPGDLVEVVLTNSPNPTDGDRTTLGAGEGWACYE